jgi:hypothetical protein
MPCGVLLLPAVVDIFSLHGVSAIDGVPSVVDIPDMAGIPSVFNIVVSDLILLRFPPVVSICSDPGVSNLLFLAFKLQLSFLLMLGSCCC